MTNNFKVAVVGAGYVGMSLATILSQQNNVTIFDINQKRIDLINSKKSTVQDKDIDAFLGKKQLSLIGTTDPIKAFSSSDFVVIATPTDFDPDTGDFDTTSVEQAIKLAIDINNKCTIIIKSTIPVGYTENLRDSFNFNEIYFSPEFLRENLALHDNLYPSRIIIGGSSKKAKLFSNLLLNSSLKKRYSCFIHKLN